MVLCCGICVEDVGDVLGSSCDSWIWRGEVVYHLHGGGYADDSDAHLICLRTGMYDYELCVKQGRKGMREAKTPMSSNERRVKRGTSSECEMMATPSENMIGYSRY